MSWRDSLAAALRAPPHISEPNPYERVAREVAEVVNAEVQAMHVEVRSRVVGNRLRLDLLTWPTRRPAERSILISMSVDASNTMWVPTPSGLGQLNDKDPETLRDYLVDLFKSLNFLAAAEHYRSRNDEPVEAWLKLADHRKVVLSDVALLVRGSEQDKLVVAYNNEDFEREVEIIADLIQPVANFRPYSPSASYAMLDSCGFVLRVTRHEPDGRGGVRVVGVPRGDLDWRTQE